MKRFVFITLSFFGCGVAQTPEIPAEMPAFDTQMDAASGPNGTFGTAWIRLTADELYEASADITDLTRVNAYVAIALYESTAATVTNASSLQGLLRGLGELPKASSAVTYDQAIAAAGAAHAVTTALAPQSRDAFDGLLETQINRRKGAGVPLEKIERSEALGREIGRAIVSWAKYDGYEETRDRPWAPSGSEGEYKGVPTAPFYGELRGFAYSECRAEEPFEFSEEIDSDFYADAEAIYFTSLGLTDEQRLIAGYWDDGALHWIRLGAQMAEDHEHRLLEAMRTQALVGVAIADAVIGAWKVKYAYKLLRPEAYIATYIDHAWTPLLETHRSPEYVSAEAAVAGAASTVLVSLYGDHYALVDKSSGFAARSYNSFDDAAVEAGESQLYGGVAFPMGVDEGLRFGRCHADATASLLRD